MQRHIGNGFIRARAPAGLATILLIAICAVGFAPLNSEAAAMGNYLTLKGGIYSPSKTFNLGNVDIETTFDSDTETGVAGEVAIGHYVLPTLALEFGVGYFNGKGTLKPRTSAVLQQADFDVIPVLLTAKAFIPAGAIFPYGELGVGAYFTKFDVTDNANTFEGDMTLGMHAGAGINVNITRKAFLGVEGRYVWANPSFGDQQIRLNDTEYALNGFELNGFTTMLALGFCF
ncbi:MAG: outer membrane beta-barrel protein [Candidatus Latescibacteria bacterium]|nr:outer membrane beta-barrel protein [Candidatus Latescibacterota bacterium]